MAGRYTATDRIRSARCTSSRSPPHDVLLLRRLVFALGGLLAVMAAVRAETPDEALGALLKAARAECAQPSDRLSRALCAGRLRVGVREYYPLFATREGETRDGYEIDVSQEIAKRLGIEPDFTRVNAATRIPLLAEDRIDLTIATMGHNTQRDSQARFIRPHYYQSETALVGPKALAVRTWEDLAARTICVTVGNGSNADIV